MARLGRCELQGSHCGPLEIFLAPAPFHQAKLGVLAGLQESMADLVRQGVTKDFGNRGRNGWRFRLDTVVEDDRVWATVCERQGESERARKGIPWLSPHDFDGQVIPGI